MAEQCVYQLFTSTLLLIRIVINKSTFEKVCTCFYGNLVSLVLISQLLQPFNGAIQFRRNDSLLQCQKEKSDWKSSA